MNVTLVVQVPPAATLLVTHVLVSEKLILTAMLVEVGVAVKVTTEKVCGGIPLRGRDRERRSVYRPAA